MILSLIRIAKLEDIEKISEFNIQMAKETEEKILDKNVVQEGVRPTLNNKIKFETRSTTKRFSLLYLLTVSFINYYCIRFL